jgi:Plasmid stabilization system protein
MAKFELTKEAAEDLFKIWEYTVDTWSEQQADKYYAQLTISFRKIAEKPSKTGSSYGEIYPGLKGKHDRKACDLLLATGRKTHTNRSCPS